MNVGFGWVRLRRSEFQKVGVDELGEATCEFLRMLELGELGVVRFGIIKM